MPDRVIGFTGSFGSGCSTIAKDFLESQDYQYISLSEILKDLYREEKKREPENRFVLQDYGNSLRQAQGLGHLAELACSTIKENPQIAKWVIDSIRNPHELTLLRNTYPSFFLIGVNADPDKRWERVKDVFNGDPREFEKADKRDSREDLEFGQRVRDCFYEADLIISNNKTFLKGNEDYNALDARVAKYVSLIENPYTQMPTEQESIMAMACACAQRSSCLKRKVGAVIVDQFGNVFSSGYNEVPRSERSCKQEFDGCYRDRLKQKLKENILSVFDAQDDTNAAQRVDDEIISQLKILDHCRALHAEENAILNVARFGNSNELDGGTIYTSTYPCNLCANKIAQAGIVKVVYLEPYPMREAKTVLDSEGVEQIPFEGVTFKGYFRLYGGLRL